MLETCWSWIKSLLAVTLGALSLTQHEAQLPTKHTTPSPSMSLHQAQWILELYRQYHSGPHSKRGFGRQMNHLARKRDARSRQYQALSTVRSAWPNQPFTDAAVSEARQVVDQYSRQRTQQLLRSGPQGPNALRKRGPYTNQIEYC